MKFDDWPKNVQRLILAPHCVLCRAPATLARDLCAACDADLPRLARACRYCALALPAESQVPACRQCTRQPRFDAATAAFVYGPPVDWFVTQLKFHKRFTHARLLASLLGDRLRLNDRLRPDYLVPVPLHATRYRERGYNQAELIARYLARTLDIPLAAQNAVTRTRATEHQLALPASRRAGNVRHAFSAGTACAGRHVAIVDDVVTTGHTAAAVAAALRGAGAASVQLWCVARA